MGMIGNSPALGVVTPAQIADADLQLLAAMSPSRASYLASNEGFGFRNRIINGDMRIDQRNNGAVVTGYGSFLADRFQVSNSGGETVAFNLQRDTVAPDGFTNSIKLTVTTSQASMAANQRVEIRQRIEGFNVADFNFGTASAATITLSFWVRTSIAGTHGGSILNGNANRSYPFAYTVSAANTWEFKTITLAGDTTGTWAKDNSTGLVVNWCMGAGTDRLGAAGAWNSNLNFGVTGQVNVVGTNGATFYITGVQLEAGTVATPFERRDYGRELMMCQRYFCLFNSSTGAAYSAAGAGAQARSAFYFPVTMRAAPTITTGTMASSSNITNDSFTSITADAKGGTYEVVQGASAGNYFASRVDNKASAEL